MKSCVFHNIAGKNAAGIQYWGDASTANDRTQYKKLAQLIVKKINTSKSYTMPCEAGLTGHGPGTGARTSIQTRMRRC